MLAGDIIVENRTLIICGDANDNSILVAELGSGDLFVAPISRRP